MRYLTTILFLLFLAPAAYAQTDSAADVVIPTKQTKAEDKTQIKDEQDAPEEIKSNVNVFKDPRLSALKARPEAVAREKAKAEIIASKKEKQAASNITNYSPINRGKKKVTGSIITRKGYRVVIYSGNNRSSALDMKRKFMRAYPNTRSYMSYISPYFKIRVGNFASKTSAYKFLRKIQGAGFSKSFVAPDIVTIKNINVR